MWTARRWGRAPEAALAILAAVVFLGFLGSLDIWGKREQRASAEAIDTIDHGHWLIAQIQGRPRLEKPPLPRWTIASLMVLTGRRDEWMVRLPSALAGLGTVGLVYALGRRLGGRSVALASGLALTSLVFFLVELRQAGNDGPLTFFTTLALYAAWRRLHGADAVGEAAEGDPLATPGDRRWGLLMYAALGLGFLTKGPVILLIAALAIIPYLAAARRLREGLGRLADGWGLLLFMVLALCWPVPVLLRDPMAARVWYLEMGQKTGAAAFVHSRRREILATSWPWLISPWWIVGTMALGLPLRGRQWAARPALWFPWSWTVGNLVMFCFWSVAKPNYFLPCLPAAAILVGIEWVGITRAAREASSWMGALARRILQFHWVVLFVAAAAAPVVVHQLMPALTPWAGAMSVAVMVSVVGSAWAWRRGGDAGAMAPLVAAWVFIAMVLYGVVAPERNAQKSHRALAASLDRILPPEEKAVMFFQQIDEGLWFYLRDRELRPVPGSQPKYNEGFDVTEQMRSNRFELDPKKRLANEKQILIEWLDRPDRASSYVLIRKKLYEAFGADPELVRRAVPIYSESGLARNELILLHATPVGRVASGPASTSSRR